VHDPVSQVPIQLANERVVSGGKVRIEERLHRKMPMECFSPLVILRRTAVRPIQPAPRLARKGGGLTVEAIGIFEDSAGRMNRSRRVGGGVGLQPGGSLGGAVVVQKLPRRVDDPSFRSRFPDGAKPRTLLVEGRQQVFHFFWIPATHALHTGQFLPVASRIRTRGAGPGVVEPGVLGS